MASKIYPVGLMQFLTGARHLEEVTGSGIMQVVLVKSTYSYNAAHNFYDDIEASIVSSEVPIDLTSPDVTVSTTTLKFDAADTGLTWSGVNDADGVGGAVVFNWTGTAATSPLVAFLDAADLTTNGSDITLTFNASGIFTIACA
jgi:hypothetical protein